MGRKGPKKNSPKNGTTKKRAKLTLWVKYVSATTVEERDTTPASAQAPLKATRARAKEIKAKAALVKEANRTAREKEPTEKEHNHMAGSLMEVGGEKDIQEKDTKESASTVRKLGTRQPSAPSPRVVSRRWTSNRGTLGGSSGTSVRSK